MSDLPHTRSSGGCVSKLLVLFLLVVAAGLGWAIFQATQPQDLSDLSGAAPVARRDMKVVLKSAIDRGYVLNLSEAELNQWLGQTLSTRQGGFLSDQVKFKRVWVRLEDGRAEIILERAMLGAPFTVSMYVQIEKMEGPDGVTTEVRLHGGPYHPDLPKPPRGGRFGKLVVPQGFLRLVMPTYEKLAALFPEELEMGLRDMNRIRIEKGKLVLDPRETLGEHGMPDSF